MNIEVFKTPDAVAQRAAAIIAAEAKATLSTYGRFVMALSGGHTPGQMLKTLAASNMPWCPIHIAQVDERVAPAGHPDRNLNQLRQALLDLTPLSPDRIHAMPVEAGDLEAGAKQYAATLERIGGTPAMLDLVHLGLGADGHTASLTPGDPVLRVLNATVAVTGAYHGRRRMTLTFPIINRSRRILWVVTGSEKASILRRFFEGDQSIPATHVCRERAIVIADEAAANGVENKCARENLECV
jgi:6-phosphogluconolactonase